MLSRMHQAGLIWPTVLAAPALIVLLALGGWQWQRMLWKEGLVARLQTERDGGTVDLGKLLPYRELDEIQLRNVRVRGSFENSKELHVWIPRDGGQVWRVITPLRLATPFKLPKTGRQITHILVIRGIVDDKHKESSTRVSGQHSGVMQLAGRIRLATGNWATPQPDVSANRWYAMQPVAMAKAVFSGASRSQVAPFLVEALGAEQPPPAPQPDLTQLHLSNRHFEYALTWWGLALTLVGVYGAFAIGRLRQQEGETEL